MPDSFLEIYCCMSDDKASPSLARVGARMYELLEKHYQSLSHQELAAKVKTQVIPHLIDIFFQPAPYKAPLAVLNRDTNESIHTALGGQHSQFSTSQKQNSLFRGTNRKQPFKSSVTQGIQDSTLKKLAGVCLLLMMASRKEQKHKKHFQSQMLEERARRAKGILRLSKFVKIVKYRSAVLKFYQNYQSTQQMNLAIKALHQLYLRKMSDHFTLAFGMQQKGMQVDAILRRLQQRRLLNLDRIFQSRKRDALAKIKEWNYGLNPWRVKWVRNIALRTKANLQTSLWRLSCFAQNQAGAELTEKPKPECEFQFSKKEQMQIFVEQLESVRKILEFEGLLEGFESLEKHGLS